MYPIFYVFCTAVYKKYKYEKHFRNWFVWNNIDQRPADYGLNMRIQHSWGAFGR